MAASKAKATRISRRDIGRALGKRDGLSASQAAYRVKGYLKDHSTLEPALAAPSVL